jgi:hypothetical protein
VLVQVWGITIGLLLSALAVTVMFVTYYRGSIVGRTAVGYVLRADEAEAELNQVVGGLFYFTSRGFFVLALLVGGLTLAVASGNQLAMAAASLRSPRRTVAATVIDLGRLLLLLSLVYLLVSMVTRGIH